MLRISPAFLVLGLLSGCVKEKGEQAIPGNSESKTSGETLASRGPEVIPRFNGSRAFDFLKSQTAFGPRTPNSASHDECLSYLTNQLRECTVEVQQQHFTHPGYNGEQLSLTNVVALFNSQASSRIMLCAHWDTRPRADQDPNPEARTRPIPGANDGASGVAVLLEIARLLKSSPPPVGVEIVLFDGEDYGNEGDYANYLIGSRYYAKSLNQANLPKFGILLDMVGDKNLELPRERNSVRYAPDIVNLVWNTATRLGIRQFDNALGDEILDDHLPLNEVGVKTIDIIDFKYPDETNRFWHTLQDTPENCSAESLEAVGTVLMHVMFGGNI